MDIKFVVNNKKIIHPQFEFDINDENKILGLCIKNITNEEQNNFLLMIETLKHKDLIINAQYFALSTTHDIYLFDLSRYKQYHFENLVISGDYSFMFAFIDENDMIINKQYYVMSLHGHQIKEL